MVLQRLVEAARKFLAGQKEIDLRQINSITPLHAAQLNRVCLQVARSLPGGSTYYLIVFQSVRGKYQVLADRSAKSLEICQGPVTGERIPLGRRVSEDEIVATAKENLAQRLDVSLDQVNVVQVDSMEWDDETLSCSHSKP